MSLAVWLGIGLLGGAGAVARVLLDAAVSGRHGRPFPYGLLVVNLSGAFALGVLVGAALDDDALRLAGTGFIGAFTTFSTWVYDSHRMAEDGKPQLAVLNFAGSLVLGVALAWIGRELGTALL